MQEVYWDRREWERERPYQRGDIRKIGRQTDREEIRGRREQQ